MPILGKLIEMYRDEGIEICTGLSAPDFADLPSAPFTRFVKNGKSITNGLGIAMQEIYLLENLLSSYKPRNVFIIGNSLGWSTLAIGLLLPECKVVAMDAGFDQNTLHGIELTNKLAARAKLNNLRAIKGVSPKDVAAVVDAELGGQVDFAFIDGLHSNAQIVLDYQAVSAKAAQNAVYLFHDVHFFNLYEGMRQIEFLAGRTAQSLRATPSGMMLLYDPSQHPEIVQAVAPFAPTKQARMLVKGEAQQVKQRFQRIKRKLRRNALFMKGVNKLCALRGVKSYTMLPE